MITNVTFVHSHGVQQSAVSTLGTAARAWLRLALVLSATLLCWLVALPAQAAVTEEGAPNMMVRPFDGPKAKALNERVVKVLEEQGADLVPAGFEGPTAMETDADYAGVAARLNIQAFIQGQATNDNTGWTLKLTVRQGSDGTVVGNGEFKASWFPGLLTKIDEELIPTLEKALSGAKVPEGVVDEPEAAPAAAAEAEKPAPKPLELDAGAGFVFRNYVANNAVNLPGVLQTRDQSGGMASLRVGAAFYPAALFTKEFLANIGVVGNFERSLGGKTAAGDAISPNLPSGDLDTTLTSYDIGLRVRLPVSTHELGFSAAYGGHQFEIDDNGTESNPDAGRAKLVPDVNYSYVRLGADFTYGMSAYFLTGDIGLRVINSAGEDPGQIQNDRWFPRSDVGGLDLGLTGGYNVSERLTITVGMDFRNFFYTMNSRAEDFGVDVGNVGTRRPVAGGANDMYFAGLVSARYSLR
ncbi:MAG: hypothetical protein RL685_5908 [Pseudomonadota bacterium]|jgi:hypothetical protein